jgi:hypothetical protein
MAVQLIAQGQGQQAGSTTSISFSISINSPSAEKGVVVYTNTGVVSSATCGSTSLTAVGGALRWFGATGITNGTYTITVNFSSGSDVRVWAGAFSDVYQTSGFVDLPDGGIFCSSGSTGAADYVYSTANPASNSSPSVGYRTLRGAFELSSTDGSFSVSSPGCQALGYTSNTPYTSQTSFDNTTGSYSRIELIDSPIPATAGNSHGSSFQGRTFEYGALSGISAFIWIVTGDGTLIPDNGQMMII